MLLMTAMVFNHNTLRVITGSLFFVSVAIGLQLASSCDITITVPPNGVISSPKFPMQPDNNTNCMWHLKPAQPHTTIILYIEELDIEADPAELCGKSGSGRGNDCCRHNWLSVPVSGVGRLKTLQMCGRHPPGSLKPIVVRSADVPVKLHISRIVHGSRGFRLSYRASSVVGDGEGEEECRHSCATGVGCFSDTQKCDGRPDCADWSDETDCHYCEKGKALCSAISLTCFHPSQRCNGILDCPMGQDEVNCVPGCEGRIGCLRGDGCYAPWQRCDGRSDCADESDEIGCPRELCAITADKRLCRNGRCLPSALWCDTVDDCGDNTDEDNCLKNSLVVTVLLGCMLCGVLLVAAIACTFRAYGQRYARVTSARQLMRIPPHIASRLRMSTSSSLPALLDDDFFLREPPPAYSVAMGEAPPAPPYRPMPRRSRRHRPRPVPPPQVVLKPPDLPVPVPAPVEASSSQSSPSRGSLSSSCMSGTDDTLLLSS